MVLKTSSARLIVNMINDDPDDDMPNQIVKAFYVSYQIISNMNASINKRFFTILRITNFHKNVKKYTNEYLVAFY